MVSFRVTEHAVERYQERVKPWLSIDAARRELLALVELADFTTRKPTWATEPELAVPRGYLLLCDSVALPVARNGSITTCVTRGGIGNDELRRRRTNRKRARRRARRSAQTTHQVNNVIKREEKSRKRFRRDFDDNEMAPAALERPEARPMEASP